MKSFRVAASHRLVVPTILLCGSLLACRDDPVVPPPAHENAVAVTYGAPMAPAWVAFRDGDGSWTRELPNGTGSRITFRHVFTSERVAIASLAPEFGGAFKLLRVLYGTPEEMSTEGDTTVADCAVGGGKTLHGNVSGLDTTQLAVVNVGPLTRTGVSPRLGLDFTVEGVASGPQDVFAARTTNGPGPTRLIFRRDIDLPNGALIPTLDFASAEAFDAVSANVSIENLGGDAAVNLTALFTVNGRFSLPFASTITSTTQPYVALPPGNLLAGDLQQLHVSTGDATARTADVYFRLPVDRAVTSAPVTFTWVPESFLAEQKVAIWSEIPAWAPGDVLMYVSVARAVAAGLTYRPFAVTARDTLDWDKSRPAAERAKRGAGMTRQREAELLALWRKSVG